VLSLVGVVTAVTSAITGAYCISSGLFLIFTTGDDDETKTGD